MTLKWCWQKAVRTLGGLAAGGIALSAASLWAQYEDAGPSYDEPYSPQPVIRSLGDTRERPLDERKLPRYAERQTHRGWEVTHDKFTVVAKSSHEDALLAADEVQRAWSETARLAENFTTVQNKAMFGVGALTVLIDNDSPDARRTPPSSLAITADTTVIYINVADEEQPLEAQLALLRGTTAAAFFHVASLDGKLPGWAREGLGDFIANPPGTEAAVAAPAQENVAVNDPGGNFDLFDFRRVGSDRLGFPPAEERQEETETATSWMRYLLVGDDARHAPELFEVLRETVEQAGAETPGGLRIARRGQDPAEEQGPDLLAAFVAERSQGTQTYAEWRKDPLVDQPVFQPAEADNPAYVDRQREMLLVLKLARRFGPGEETPVLRPKVVEFGAQGARPVVTPSADSRAIDLGELQRRLTSQDAAPWATIDVDGRLLTQKDTDRLEELFGLDEGRYSTHVEEGRQVLAYQLDEKTAVSAWLEEDANQPRRPVAKFRVDRTR